MRWNLLRMKVIKMDVWACVRLPPPYCLPVLWNLTAPLWFPRGPARFFNNVTDVFLRGRVYPWRGGEVTADTPGVVLATV